MPNCWGGGKPLEEQACGAAASLHFIIVGGNVMAADNRVRHWTQTARLMYISLAIWFFFAFFIHLFVVQLNSIVILGFPLGFYMAAQGSLIAFVALLAWFAWRQNRIDREHGLAEEQETAP
jgi:putative solute:sodium symporter small subunit